MHLIHTHSFCGPVPEANAVMGERVRTLRWDYVSSGDHLEHKYGPDPKWKAVLNRRTARQKAMADTEPQMEVEQQEEEVVEEVSNAEEAASEVVEEVEGGAETKEEDATEEDAEAEAPAEATSWISFHE